MGIIKYFTVFFILIISTASAETVFIHPETGFSMGDLFGTYRFSGGTLYSESTYGTVLSYRSLKSTTSQLTFYIYKKTIPLKEEADNVRNAIYKQKELGNYLSAEIGNIKRTKDNVLEFSGSIWIPNNKNPKDSAKLNSYALITEYGSYFVKLRISSLSTYEGHKKDCEEIKSILLKKTGIKGAAI